MHYSQIVDEALKNPWWLVLIAFIILIRFLKSSWFKGFFKSSWFKGFFGELKVLFSAKLLLHGYYQIHNVTLPTLDGTTQIDHIFVSRFGIFVVETKNMTGWIFGSEKQAQWTQKIYRNSYKFQNPLRQNYKHVKALEAALSVPAESIHSVVVFFGHSTFKTKMPAKVTKSIGYVSYIKSFKQPVFSDSQVQEVVEQIASVRLESSMATHRAHVQSLRARSDPEANRQCPRCGSAMIIRTAKQGARAGNHFWGCSSYPKCRMVQNII